jgi:ATP-binding cassette subfamily B protein
VHGAERILRDEHEGLLVRWGQSWLSLVRAGVVLDAVSIAAPTVSGAWLLFRHLRSHDLGQALLLAYFCLTLPSLGERLAGIVRQLPGLRNAALRVSEPLAAPSETTSGAASRAIERAPSTPSTPAPFGIVLRQVTVRAGGHALLAEADLAIEPGQHVAIVGPSGAGKSTLVGLLLGWHRGAEGSVELDGQPLDGALLAKVRREIAWIDPEVLLWNRSLLDNLRYGNGLRPLAEVPEVIEAAALRGVLERLPEGLQTALGESGALVSGGEGQRVRLGRGLFRRTARLVILDEPFRGLDRERRHQLLRSVRERFRGATLLFVSHDVSETLEFERVIVVDSGRLVEDGAPAALQARAGSRYRALLEADRAVREGLWAGPLWRRLRVERGRLVESPAVEVAREGSG